MNIKSKNVWDDSLEEDVHGHGETIGRKMMQVGVLVRDKAFQLQSRSWRQRTSNVTED